MADNKDIIEQTKLAFDFMERLYLEVSYLIKEIEGILRKEKEEFVIGRPSGYGISARSSTGLESASVSLWLLRTFSVFFVPKGRTGHQGGVTTTKIDGSLKVLYLRVLLNDRSVEQPAVYAGVLHNIIPKPTAKPFEKFEHAMNHLEYHVERVFTNPDTINYEDGRIKVQGKLMRHNLFDIKDSKTVMENIVKPLLELYKKY